jgi:hypothetical protein
VIEPDAPRLLGIRLKNVRGFEDLRLDFESPSVPHPYGGVGSAAVVIGRNGTNKSTLLRAIAFGLASFGEAASLLSTQVGSFVGPIEKSASVSVTVLLNGVRWEYSRIVTRNENVGGLDSVAAFEDPPDLLVCGYGAGRGVTGTDSGRSYSIYDGVLSLFDYRATLLSPELTLRRLQDWLGTRGHYARVIESIARLMGLEDGQINVGIGGGITVSSGQVGLDVPLEALADGYRVAFNWIIDLYGRAMSRDWIRPDGSIGAIVLIDEIEQHLHPELQVRVVDELQRAFPSSTFVVTTHSHVVALGAHPSQLIALERVGDRVSALRRVPDYRAYSPEDVLTDRRLFGTTARNPQFEALLHRRDDLAANAPETRTSDENDELRRVAAAIRDAPTSESEGRSPESQRLFDELLAGQT